MNSNRSTTTAIRALLALATCVAWTHAPGAGAASLGPDGPGWAVVKEPDLPRPSASADEVQLAPADPLSL